MKNLAPKLSIKEYENNFAELHPPLTKLTAKAEAERCLYCFDSPCTKACPTHIDIPAFIKKISTDNLLGSANTILGSNWIALTCAKACPVEELCEGACVYNEKGEKPIEIGRLQRYAMDNYYKNPTSKIFSFSNKKNKSVGIIGSGPAGLACGAELTLLGYDVTIYEANKTPGGLNSWGIAPYKMRQKDSLKEVKLIKSLGVKIKTGIKIGETISIDALFKKHDAIFLGVGLSESPGLAIPGENLKGVVDALSFIEEVKCEKWNKVKIGKRVAVIGAGNTAIDAATEAKRLGAEKVSIIYRRSTAHMSAYDFEYALAKNDEVNFYFNTVPQKILGRKFVEGIKCKKSMIIKNGKAKISLIPNSEFVIPVDMVIKAIGQKPYNSFFNSIPNLKLKDGKVVVNPETYQTGNSKLFAGGDCINGGKEVVNAAYDGKMAAHGIDEFLSN
ncbi:MAG: NAD(P)-dependent oxidoreductase [Bacteroidetes bacterium]|nr:NAD(P)-dependent oxidoreductase [Bacteroidota bacterium]